jgi:hypothetical protein
MKKKASKAALFEAATRWDAPALAEILAAAPELAPATDPRGRTALHLACRVPPGKGGLGEANGTKTVWFAVARGQNLVLVKSRGAAAAAEAGLGHHSPSSRRPRTRRRIAR